MQKMFRLEMTGGAPQELAVVCEELPVNACGKVLKNEVIGMIQKRTGREEAGPRK